MNNKAIDERMQCKSNSQKKKYTRSLLPPEHSTRSNTYYPTAIVLPTHSTQEALTAVMIGHLMPEWLEACLRQSWATDECALLQKGVDIWSTLKHDDTNALYTFLYGRTSYASLQTLSDVCGSSLLHEACRLGAYRCCEVLLREGALPNQCSVPPSDRVCCPALHTALRYANPEDKHPCWRLLLQHLIDMDPGDLWAQRPRKRPGHEETGHEFLAMDADKNTNLHVAMEMQNQECVGLLQRHMSPDAWCSMLCVQNSSGDKPEQHGVKFRRPVTG